MTKEKTSLLPISKHPGISLYASEGYRNRESKIHISYTEIFTAEGELAMRLVERWGMVMVEADGEDSSGRQKVRHQTPPELVERALAVAKELFEQARKAGVRIKIPDALELEKMLDDNKDVTED